MSMEQPGLPVPPQRLAATSGGPFSAPINLFESIAQAREEVAVFAYFDPQWRLLGMRHMASGLSDAVNISLREVVADALAFDCTVVVMAHNHPSGDPTPSQTDYAFTRRLSHVLDVLGMRLYDHLILARDGFESFRRNGLL